MYFNDTYSIEKQGMVCKLPLYTISHSAIEYSFYYNILPTDCRLTVSLFLMGRGGGLVGEVGDLEVVAAAPCVGEAGGGGYTDALDGISGFLGDCGIGGCKERWRESERERERKREEGVLSCIVGIQSKSMHS